MWHVSPESKIQLVNCKLPPKSLLVLLSLSDICVIDAYTYWSFSLSTFLHYLCGAQLHLSLKRTWFCHISFSLGGFGYLAIRWYLDLHLTHLQGVRSVRCLSEAPATRYFSFLFLILTFFYRIVSISTKVHFNWTIYSLSLFLP